MDDLPARCEHRWIFDTGGSGRGAWAGGFGYRLARSARAGGFYPGALLGSSIGAYNSMDLATGEPEVLLRSWTNWARPVPVTVTVAPGERGMPGSYGFRKTVKESVAFTLDPPTENRLFDPENCARLFIVASEVLPPHGGVPGRREMWQMFLQTITRKSRHKYLPRSLRYRPVVFARGMELTAGAGAPGEPGGGYPLPPRMGKTGMAPRPALPRDERLPPVVVPLERGNIRQALLASCLIPMVMGRPLLLDGRSLVDGGFTLKVPLSFAGSPGGAALDRAAGAERTLVIVNNPEGRLWKTTMRLAVWNDEPWVRAEREAGRLLIARPSRPIRASTISRNPELTRKTFDWGQEEAEVWLKQEAVRRFFRL